MQSLIKSCSFKRLHQFFYRLDWGPPLPPNWSSSGILTLESEINLAQM